MSTAIDLDEYLVPGTSNTYYIPEFVTEEEEEFLIRKVHLGMRRRLRCLMNLTVLSHFLLDP